MRVSVCVTVFNEEKTISKLLDSLLRQTKKPDEIVIVDADSKDKTFEIIRHYQKKDKRIKLLIEKGSTAHGRNTSIDLAKNEIIASTDAGCVAKVDWLQKITEPFKHKDVSLVAGFYEMPAQNSLQKAMNTFHGVIPEEFDPISFLPSARSVAFRKSVWEEVGGYSERLTKAAEDTDFFFKVVKAGFKIARVKEARVAWEETATLGFKDSIKKFFHYAKGDAEAGIWWHPTKQLASHNIKISLIFVRYFVGLGVLALAFVSPIALIILSFFIFLYVLWAIRKVYLKVNDWRAGLWGAPIQLSSDIVVMFGFASGLFASRRQKL